MDESTSKGDFYCNLCNAPMSGQLMWDSHIAGKRHLKNLKKRDGDMPLSMPKTVKVDNATPQIMKKLERVNEVLIGLNHMYEIQKDDPDADPSYTCNLCHAPITRTQVVEHVISTKHRLNTLKIDYPEAYTLVENMQLSKDSKDSIVSDKAQELEARDGRGVMQVVREDGKGDTSSSSQRKRQRGGDDDRHRDGKQRYQAGSSIMPPVLPPEVDINLEDLDLYPIDIKLHYLEVLSQCPINTVPEVKMALKAVNVLSSGLLTYKAREQQRQLDKERSAFIQEMQDIVAMDMVRQQELLSNRARNGNLRGLRDDIYDGPAISYPRRF